MVRIIIAGGRDFNNYEFLELSVDSVLTELSIKNMSVGLGSGPAGILHGVEFISGTARGADTLGENFAASRDWKVMRFPANWDAYGKSAGYIRNEQMAKVADACVCFWDEQSKGTKHMIDLAKQYKLALRVVNYNKYN